MNNKSKIVSGMRPTGKMHLGNYWGALKNWIELQDKYNCMFFVADWHALTDGYEDTSKIKENITQMVIDWLAAGLDPKKCVIFKQSDIVEHAELSLLLGMITPLTWLLKCPTYREQLIEYQKVRYAGQEGKIKQPKGKTMQSFAGAQNIDSEKEISALAEFSSFGFLGYPVLMTSDIVVHGGEFVPVGKDQLAHLEISRDIVRRFSELYGKNVLIEPKPLLTEVPRIAGIDGRKMSKSYNNAIEMGESADTLKKKVMRMYTDPSKKRANDLGNPENCVVFSLHKLYNSQYETRETECMQGTIGCVKCKEQLLNLLKSVTEDFRNKRENIEKNISSIDEILADGAKKAKESAVKTLKAVRAAVKI